MPRSRWDCGTTPCIWMAAQICCSSSAARSPVHAHRLLCCNAKSRPRHPSFRKHRPPPALPPCQCWQVCRDAGIKVHAFNDFVAGSTPEEVTPVPPKPDDMCCIMYTRCGRPQ